MPLSCHGDGPGAERILSVTSQSHFPLATRSAARSSHEVNKLALLPDEVLREMIDDDLVLAHRRRALNPDNPMIRGTAQNPDVFFQSREASTPFYQRVPGIVEHAFETFERLTGRSYKLFDYHGAPDAETVMV
ncbi:MAG: hypothetical protein ABR510_14910, partial [Trueperaceae bacterium]